MKAKNKIQKVLTIFICLALTILVVSCDNEEKVEPKSPICPHNNYSDANPVPDSILNGPQFTLTGLARENNYQGIGVCQIFNNYVHGYGTYWEFHKDCKPIIVGRGNSEVEGAMRAAIISGECY